MKPLNRGKLREELCFMHKYKNFSILSELGKGDVNQFYIPF